ncbi:hypothetical protein [Rothia nasimurium]|uniref:hypothetical protein n=1 Tax=Rothia nasimurium TaxID=85336 RepID=UPI001F3C53B3|nr:hypothetical protein [Rothia nasimurium]
MATELLPNSKLKTKKVSRKVLRRSSAEKRQTLLTPEEKNNLLNRWLEANPQRPTREEVYILLEEKYGAYQLPLAYMEPDGYHRDEEIRADTVDSLYTITHPIMLNTISWPLDTYETDKIFDGGYTETAEERAEIAEWKMQLLFDQCNSNIPLEYRIISTQHSLGHRVSLILMAENGRITDYKMYGSRGMGNSLDRYLRGWIGFPTNAHKTPKKAPT